MMALQESRYAVDALRPEPAAQRARSGTSKLQNPQFGDPWQSHKPRFSERPFLPVAAASKRPRQGLMRSLSWFIPEYLARACGRVALDTDISLLDTDRPPKKKVPGPSTQALAPEQKNCGSSTWARTRDRRKLVTRLELDGLLWLGILQP